MALTSTIAKTVVMPRERILAGESSGEDENKFNYALRPQRFEQYIGQGTLIWKLRIAVEAAKGRGEPIEHILLHGPPGLGKTTLAHVIANEVGTTAHVVAGPAMTKRGGVSGGLPRLGQGDNLFIDENQPLPPPPAEGPYS